MAHTLVRSRRANAWRWWWCVALTLGLGAGCAELSGEPDNVLDDADVSEVTVVGWERVVVDPSPGRRALEKEVADLSGDGKGDIILGHGAGVRWYQFPASGNPRDRWIRRDILTRGDAYEQMQIRDLNGDRRPDIILSIGRRVEWLQHPGGAGTGAWTVHLIANGIGHEVRVADLDGDGRLDVITSRTRNLNFQNSPTSWAPVAWGRGASGDPQDGLDLLNIGSGRGAINVVGANSGGIYWFENPRERGGNARVASAWIAHRIGDNDTGGPALATVDVNGDGRVDVVQAPNEGAQGVQGLIWWQAPADRRNGAWVRRTIDRSWQAVHKIEVADLDRDGNLDLILGEQEQSHDPVGGPYSFTNDRIGVFYNDGTGRLTRQIVSRAGGQNQVARDLDGDSDLDLVVANHGVYGAPNPVELYLNRLR
ncbi:MAG: VCBS repeat-containing protein [Kofleriaceae bacterium]